MATIYTNPPIEDFGEKVRRLVYDDPRYYTLKDEARSSGRQVPESELLSSYRRRVIGSLKSGYYSELKIKGDDSARVALVDILIAKEINTEIKFG